MKCYACGKEVREGARFCVACGANLMEAPAPAAEPAPQDPATEAPAQPKYEYTPPVPQPQPQPQAPVYQPWPQPQVPVYQPQPQPGQTWAQQPPVQSPPPYQPYQNMPNTQYVYTYSPQAAPGSPQIVYVKTKTRGRGFGISSMVLGIIGLYYALSGMAIVGEVAQFAALGEEMLGEMMGEIPSGMFAESMAVSLGVFGIMPLLALIFGICARKRGYKNGVSMSGLIMGIIGLVLITLEIIAVAGSGI